MRDVRVLPTLALLAAATTPAVAQAQPDPSFNAAVPICASGCLLPGPPDAEVLATQAGGYVVVGYTGADQRSYLVRFTPGGALDTSFGSGGVAAAPDAITLSGLRALGGGKLLALGDGDGVPVVQRYDADGAPDRTFGRYAERTLRFGGSGAEPVFDSTGAILLGGTLDNIGSGDGLIARYSSSGAPVREFHGGAARLPVALVGSDLNIEADIQAMAATPDGGVLAEADGDLVHFTKHGTIDRSFGHGGVVKPGDAEALAVQRDGTIVAAGSEGSTLLAIRYSSRGAHPRTATLAMAGAPQASGVVLDAQGDATVLGGSPSFLARFTANGGADCAFGTGGSETLAEPSDVGAMVAQGPGSVLVARSSATQLYVQRYVLDGAPQACP